MKITGIPDFVRANTMDRALDTVKTNLFRASQELVTGRKQDLSKALGAQVEEYDLVSKALADLDAAETRMTIADGRLSQVSFTLETIRTVIGSIADEAESDLRLRNSQGAREARAAATSHITAIMSQLNTERAGRSLFGGDRVDVTAVGSGEELLAAVNAALGGATDPATLDTVISDFFATRP